MERLEFIERGRIVPALVVLLALTGAAVGVGARAEMPAPRPAHAVMAQTEMPMAGSHTGSVLTDCMPCALCYAAPGIAVQGFSGESKEPVTPTWMDMAERPEARATVDMYRRRQSLLPLRIAYCRWSK